MSTMTKRAAAHVVDSLHQVQHARVDSHAGTPGARREATAMIRVTATAATSLRQLLMRAKGQPGQAVRLTPNGRGGVAMGIGSRRAGDAAGPVLIVAAVLTQSLDGMVLDLIRGGLTFRPSAGDEPGVLVAARVPA